MKQQRIQKLYLIVLVISLVLASCAQSMQARRADYVTRNPHLPTETKGLILNGKIAIGMSRDDVISSWGAPDNYMTESQGNVVGEVFQYNIDKVNSWFGLTPDQGEYIRVNAPNIKKQGNIRGNAPNIKKQEGI